MKDIFFYPLCALIVAGVIAYALSFSEEAAPIDITQGFEVSGEQLQYLQVPERLESSLVTDEQTDNLAAILTSNVNKKSAPPSAGISVRLGPEFEKAFEGKTLEMTVRARANSSATRQAFQIGYFSIGSNSSGWKEFTPSENYDDYTVRFTKKAPTGEAAGDYAGIWPDMEGLGRKLNVASITVKAVENNQGAN